MEFQTMLSERGNPLIIYESFKFRKHRELKKFGEIVWACTNKNCPAKVYTLNSVFSRISGSHNHVVNECVINRQRISNAVKRKAEQGSCFERPSKLIHLEINKQKDTLTSLSSKDMRYISQTINHTKRKTLPKLPKSSNDVQEFLDKNEIQTSKNESFVFINDRQSNIVVFSCKSNVEFMCLQDTLFMDGTFDYCPKFFLQMFSIHAFTNNIYVPVAFCLLKNKQKSTYKSLFELLRNKCTDLNLNFNPLKIVIDFEMGIHSSANDIFTNALIVGCRFHLAQSWWRKIQSIGLTSEYKNVESQTGIWLRHLFGLTFLSPDEVGDSLVEDFIAEKPNDSRIDQFVDYLVETYIEENSTFPPQVWAAQTASIYRTTNACEAFHSKFKANCSSPHPNIYVFLETLHNIQTDSYIKINSVNKNEKRIIRKDVLAKQDFINSKILQYESNQISRYNFVKCVSYKFSSMVLSN